MDNLQKIKVAVVGAAGRMGREVLQAIHNHEDFEIGVAVDHSHNGESLREVVGPRMPDLKFSDKVGASLDETPCQVLVDFTHPGAAAGHAVSALKRGVRPVIGTTGMSDNDLRDIQDLSREKKLGAIYAPNFAIGAVLMMKFSEMAAKWLPDAEIVEMHHENKHDAPSGTAMLTADLIANARTASPHFKADTMIKVEGARGGAYRGINMHAIRLPGYVAHQMVMFGNAGEILTIRHDSTDRKCFMEGVKLCCREVMSLNELVIGMDKLLFDK